MHMVVSGLDRHHRWANCKQVPLNGRLLFCDTYLSGHHCHFGPGRVSVGIALRQDGIAHEFQSTHHRTLTSKLGQGAHQVEIPVTWTSTCVEKIPSSEQAYIPPSKKARSREDPIIAVRPPCGRITGMGTSGHVACRKNYKRGLSMHVLPNLRATNYER